MKASPSPSTEAFFLEMGAIPIGVIIQARRINYLHSILRRDQSGKLYSFFLTQWYKPSKGDWTVQVQKDLEMFGIKCDFEYIRSKSKKALKNVVKLKLTF